MKTWRGKIDLVLPRDPPLVFGNPADAEAVHHLQQAMIAMEGVVQLLLPAGWPGGRSDHPCVTIQHGDSGMYRAACGKAAEAVVAFWAARNQRSTTTIFLGRKIVVVERHVFNAASATTASTPAVADDGAAAVAAVAAAAAAGVMDKQRWTAEMTRKLQQWTTLWGGIEGTCGRHHDCIKADGQWHQWAELKARELWHVLTTPNMLELEVRYVDAVSGNCNRVCCVCRSLWGYV